MRKNDTKTKTTGFRYKVVLEAGVLKETGSALNRLFSSRRAILVSDNKVFPLYGEEILSSLKAENWIIEPVLIRPGERSKTLRGASRLYDAAVEFGLDRGSPVIALGGGVVGDLAGFAAATYMRGVPLVMLPTSLLAQVDSSVGGKVAVNHPRGKNIIGSFYHPSLVLIDPLVLKTLPRRQLKAGLAEVIKYGIIADPSFFDYLEESISLLLRGDSKALIKAIAGSVRTKKQVVEKDEFEGDYRRILNFGHTIGHALEAATAYKTYLHGEAVLIGMYTAVELAHLLEMLKEDEKNRIQYLLKKIGIKKPPSDLTAEMVIDKLRQDKKRRDDDLIFVLPSTIGKVSMMAVKEIQLIRHVIDEYLGC